MAYRIAPRPDGTVVGEVEGLDLTVDGGALTAVVDADGKLFQRVAIKKALTPDAREVRWLVGELQGVRVYVARGPDGVSLVLTTQDLYP